MLGDRTWGCGSALAGAVMATVVAGCGQDPPFFTTGGSAPTTSTSQGGGGSGGAAGQGGTGGAGGDTFAGCDACPAEAPICVDAKECAAACPDGRDLCHPAGAPAAGACCATGEQCCEAGVFGYTAGDMCRPDGEACPLGCPDSQVACALHQYCQLQGQTGDYSCTGTCAPEQICGFNLCCPTGTLCVEGTCALPDLTVDAAALAESVKIEVVDFPPDACEIYEQCVGGPGKRTLLRFALRTPNIGAGDLHLGNPLEMPALFSFSPCHNHYHFDSYADYRMTDADGNEVAFGHKQAFCLEDVERDTAPPDSEQKYNCKLQGIQKGWADVYSRGLPCQWVDITDLPAGQYTLHASINFKHILAESDFGNNIASIPVEVPENTCPNGCIPVDAQCCKPDDPCGWAANGSCDCGDFFGWDTADCSSCAPSVENCLTKSSCTAGCSPNVLPCCAEGDPCGLANNFSCDCEAAFDWDDADCGQCDNPNPPCPQNTCPNGCTPPNVNSQCCAPGNPCGWDGDGFCDCGGQMPWDSADCSHCTSNDPDCP